MHIVVCILHNDITLVDYVIYTHVFQEWSNLRTSHAWMIPAAQYINHTSMSEETRKLKWKSQKMHHHYRKVVQYIQNNLRLQLITNITQCNFFHAKRCFWVCHWQQQLHAALPLPGKLLQAGKFLNQFTGKTTILTKMMGVCLEKIIQNSWSNKSNGP